MKQTLQERHNRMTQKRRYPFKKITRLIDFTTPPGHRALRQLVDNLRPYLMDGEATWTQLTRLYFDHAKLAGNLNPIYVEIAKFLIAAENNLTHKKSVLFRFLTHQDHSNLDISEDCLKTIVNQKIREIS